MKAGDTYDNAGERLLILTASAHEVRYQKQHWRAIRNERGQHVGGYEPYYHTYVIGTDRAYQHIQKGFWVPVISN